MFLLIVTSKQRSTSRSLAFFLRPRRGASFFFLAISSSSPTSWLVVFSMLSSFLQQRPGPLVIFEIHAFSLVQSSLSLDTHLAQHRDFFLLVLEQDCFRRKDLLQNHFMDFFHGDLAADAPFDGFQFQILPPRLGCFIYGSYP